MHAVFDHKVIRILSIIIGAILSIVVLVVGFQLFAGVFTRAADEEPQDVVINDISQNTSKISWTTASNTQGVIEYGTSPTALNFFAPETAQTQNHNVELTLLSPGSTYYFQVRIGDKKYDNKGIPWTFTTKSTDSAPVPTIPTVKPTVSGPSPTPISSITLPGDGVPASTCGVTDCVAICQKMGKGCSTTDLVSNSCIGKVDISTCSVTATATPTVAPSP